MAGCHHRLNGHGFGWTAGVGDGQGGLACCDSWDPKELGTTEQLSTHMDGKMGRSARNVHRYQFSSVQFSCSAVSNSLQPHESQHASPLSITNSWSLLKLMSVESVMHPAILSSVVPFSSCLQSLPASGPFPMSQLLA